MLAISFSVEHSSSERYFGILCVGGSSESLASTYNLPHPGGLSEAVRQAHAVARNMGRGVQIQRLGLTGQGSRLQWGGGQNSCSIAVQGWAALSDAEHTVLNVGLLCLMLSIQC